MNRKLLNFFTIFIMFSLFISCQVKAQEDEAEKKVNYKYKYNTVTPKAPQITASMQPGIKEYKSGNYIGAVQEFSDLIEKEKNNSFAKYYLALSYSQLGYRSEAQELFQEIVDKRDNYMLAYYSEHAMNCIDNMDSDTCRPPKKATIPVIKKDEAEETIEENIVEKEPISDIEAFIKSGKKIHPDANDRITRERLERKLQADEYLKKQEEQPSIQQENPVPKKHKKPVEGQ